MKILESAQTERKGMALADSMFTSLDFAFRSQEVLDVGIDAHAELLENGHATGQCLGLQIKSGPSYLSRSQDDCYIFDTDSPHVEYWIQHALPILICLCDIENQQVYWQEVNRETTVSTGQRFKIEVPQCQKVDTESRSKLQDILTPIVPTQRYTLFKTEDVSHWGAKRYAFRVVLNGTASKAEVAAIVRQVTREGRRRRYHRNQHSQQQWGNSDAQVVWGFIYPSADDEKRNLKICRSLWIDDDLPKQFQPSKFIGENVGDDIIVDWDSNYEFFSQRYAKDSVTKEEYFSRVLPLFHEIKEQLAIMRQKLDQLSRSEISEEMFLSSTRIARGCIDKIDSQVSLLPPAPYECSDLDQAFHPLVANVSNIALYYLDTGQKQWNADVRRIESKRQAGYADQALRRFEFELDKVL